MLEAGAVEEVRALLALDLDPALPAMKALGVREIAAYLAGRAVARTRRAAGRSAPRRNYVKRQVTWFRHQLAPDLVLRSARSADRRVFEAVDRFLADGAIVGARVGLAGGNAHINANGRPTCARNT